jgi:putative transposase
VKEEVRRGAAQDKGVRIRIAFVVFGISQTCYRYQAKLASENTSRAVCCERSLVDGFHA